MVTIVIPTYNRAHLVERTLDSVAAQTYRPLRLVVVDNASTDDTAAVLERWAAEHRAPDFGISILSESRPGAATARARGLEAVETEWTMFFDSDDVMLPGHVRRAVDTALAYPEADIVGWNVHFCIPGMKTRTLPFDHRDHVYHSLMHGTFATQRYMARTALFRRAGGWNPDVIIWDDIELSLRMLALGPKIVHAGSEITVNVLFTPESITGQDFSHNYDRICHTLAVMESVAPAAWMPLLAIKRAIIAGRFYREGHPDYADAAYRQAIDRCSDSYTRMLTRIAYHHTRIGLPGAARLLKPLIPNS